MNKCYFHLAKWEVNPLERNLKLVENLLSDKNVSDNHVDILYNSIQGNILIAKNNPKKARSYFYKSISICKGNKFQKKILAEQFQLISRAFRIELKYDSAILYYDSSLVIDSKNTVVAAICLNGKAGVFYVKHEYDSAIQYLSRSLKILDSLGCKSLFADKARNMGDIYYDQKMYSEAVGIYSKSYRIAKNLNEDFSKYLCLANLVKIYAIQGKCDSVEKYSPELIYYFKSFNYSTFLSMVYEAAGSCAVSSNSYEKALNYYLKILEVNDSTEDVSFNANSYFQIGNIYSKQNNPKNVQYYAKALEIARKEGQLGILEKVYSALSQHYEKQGDKNQALSIYKIFKTYSDSVKDRAVINDLNDLDKKYQTSLLKKENKSIESQLKISELRRSRQTILTVTMLIGLALAILIFLLATIKNREKQKRLNLIQENLKEELKALRTQITSKIKIASHLDEKEIETMDSFSFRLKSTILNELKLEKDWMRFDAKFEEIYPKFMGKLLNISSSLSVYDLRYCALLKLGLNTSEIADVLYISVGGSKKSSWRIRKKLDIEKGVILKDYVAIIN